VVDPSLTITFARGARRVTGSNFLVTVTGSTGVTKILIDCGLTQGEKFCDSVNGDSFVYDPSEIDAVFFTHAHADHIGLFPKLVKDGFKGKAYATAPTKDLMPIMLEDSVSIMKIESDRCGEPAPYTADDIGRAVGMLESVPYHHPITVGGARVTLVNAGHILGSATILIEAAGKRVLFTGDLGRTPAILAPDPEATKDVDVLVIESVYGNRTHGSVEDSEHQLRDAVLQTVKEKGTLLIPAFSLERTQIILAALDRMITAGTLPAVSVFMDSPLAAKVTDVYSAYPEFLRDDVRERLKGGDDPFGFPSLKVTVNKESSHMIDSQPTPKIIIAGAGMSHGGRIRHHEKKYLPFKNTTLLLVGYQVAGSLGRRLKDGQKEIEIDGERIQVKARIAAIGGFSAHADRDDLVAFAEAVNPKRVFVVLGETEAATFLAQRISGFLGLPVDVPKEGEVYEI
jgi:metallo-beta-lactamase family protein